MSKRVLPRDRLVESSKRAARDGDVDGDGLGKPTDAAAAGSDEPLVFEDEYGDEYESESGSGSNEDSESDEEDQEGGAMHAGVASADATAATSLGSFLRSAGGPADADADDDDSDDDDAGDSAIDGASRPAAADGDGPASKTVWRPGIDALAEGETLECDMEAYVMYHTLDTEWPCLSFDIVPDRLGMARTKFPLSCTVVAGTQAARADKNSLLVMRFSSLHKTQHDGRRGGDSDEEDADSGSEDGDAELEALKIAHPSGAINRVRVMPQEPHIVAAWSEAGAVELYDVRPHLRLLDAREGRGPGAPPLQRGYGPVKSFTGHATEGFAVAWSPVAPGRLVTGACDSSIFVWNVDAAAAGAALAGAGASSSSSSSSVATSAAELGAVWKVDTASPYTSHTDSVEDLAWSPNEATVFASCSVDRMVRIWDTRAKGRSMLHVDAHAADVNVVSWSPLVSFLLLSGADDGSFKIWDLRKFAAGGGSAGGAAEAPLPIAHFSWHRAAITSLEWAADDENVFVVSSEDNQVTLWDMSLETDEEAEIALHAAAASGGAGAALGHPRATPAPLPSTRDPHLAAIPPQLLFIHAGQREVKEARFHRQLPGVIISTAADGFNVFKPDVVTTT